MTRRDFLSFKHSNVYGFVYLYNVITCILQNFTLEKLLDLGNRLINDKFAVIVDWTNVRLLLEGKR